MASDAALSPATLERLDAESDARYTVVESVETAFLRPEVVLNLHWLLAFSVMMGIVALISLLGSITAGLAPASQLYPPYSYTWTMSLPSMVLWALALPCATWRNADLIFATFIFYAALLTLNLSVFLLQFVGIFVEPLTFFSRAGWYGFVISVLILVLNAVAFSAVMSIYLTLVRRADYKPRCGKHKTRNGGYKRA